MRLLLAMIVMGLTGAACAAAPNESAGGLLRPQAGPTMSPTPSTQPVIVELECPPGDPQPDVISDRVERPGAPATPREALQRYLDIHGFDVDADRFHRVEGAGRAGVEIWALEAGGKIRVVVDIVEGRLPGWSVSSFRSCFAWEQAHLAGT